MHVLLVTTIIIKQIMWQSFSADSESGDSDSSSIIDSLPSLQDYDRLGSGDFASKNSTLIKSSEDLQKNKQGIKVEQPIDILRKVSGNDKCADCGKPEPDWASLNLGILVCIECSGVHRNLGVHKSKVSSWYFIFISIYMFHTLSRSYCSYYKILRERDNRHFSTCLRIEYSEH